MSLAYGTLEYSQSFWGGGDGVVHVDELTPESLWDVVDHGVVVFTGTTGSGKTAAAVHNAYFLKVDEGRHIWTNMKAPTTPEYGSWARSVADLTLEELDAGKREGHVVLYDELHVDADSHSWQTPAAKGLFRAAAQARKDKVLIFGTTPDVDNILKRLRNLMKRGLLCWNPDGEAKRVYARITDFVGARSDPTESDDPDEGLVIGRMSWPTVLTRDKFETHEMVIDETLMAYSEKR